MTDLRMYVIYDHPRDFPNSVVLRRWRVTPDGPQPEGCCLLTHSITEARAFVPDGLVNTGRQLSDDPAIAEVWL